MIDADFFKNGDELCGFEIKGHSGYGEQGTDIICASVSSAAFMTANTITDILFIDADISLNDDGFFKFVISPCKEAQPVLRGFELHLKALSQDYPENIKVTSNGGANNA